MMPDAHTAALRTLAFHRTWGHAPTLAEWIATCEGVRGAFTCEDLADAVRMLVEGGTVVHACGRYVLTKDGAEFISRQREHELWAPRKRRIARRVAGYLSRLSSVRFVALCNTAALGHARDESDLDFFVVSRAGTIMTTRLLAVLPFKLLGRRPKPGDERDAVCLSYFVSDDALDLSGHMLEPDDPYFRYWFLSLLPLYDDGVSRDLWLANPRITSHHLFAESWIAPPDIAVRLPRVRVPVPSFAEGAASHFQKRAFPHSIVDLMNRDTRVIVNERALKFHVDDGRAGYRDQHAALCRELGV